MRVLDTAVQAARISITMAASALIVFSTSRCEPGIGEQEGRSQFAVLPSLTFSLVNATNAQPIAGFDPIADGTTINLGSLPSQLSIRANPAGSVGSIVFSLDGTYSHTENVAPYSLCGDATTSYTPCSQLLAIGGHSLSGTAFSASGGTGTASPVSTVTFSIQSTTSTPPSITSGPSNQTISAGQMAMFSVVASGSAPLTYQWKKNGTDIAGATSATYTTPAETSSDNGASFTVVVSNSLGSVTSGAATLSVMIGTMNSMFPLSVSSNGRYLIDHNGVPFPILGDAGWESAHNLSSADQQAYLTDRAGRGFNSVLIEAIEHKFTSNRPPRDFTSNLPFTTRLDANSYTGSPNGTNSVGGNTGQFPADPYTNINTQSPDLTFPTSAYWSQMDAFISLCATNGVEVFLFPAYVGYAGGDEGWMNEMVANDAVLGAGGFGGQSWSNNSKSRLWNYGAWLAQHYAAYANIIWVLGGDYGTSQSGSFTTAQSNAVASLLAGMKSVTSQQSHLWTSHWGRPSLGTDVPQFAASMDLQSIYENASSASQSRSGYASSPARPAFELEDYYEGNSSGGEPDRRFQWWSFLGNISGQFHGNEALWPFASNWQSQLASQGARDMAQLNSFIRSVPWQTLIPSGLNGQRAIVVGNGGNATGSDYIACAADSGTITVCYVPPGWALANFTVDSGVMNSAYRARWFNPTTGAFSLIGTSLANTGTRVFTPPGNNGSGFTDWVLLLDLVATVPNNPPTVTSIAQAVLNTSATAAALSVAGADDGGEPNLVYTWAAIGTPPAPVAFSVNGTNAAKNSVATFTRAGTYTLQATITDAQLASVTSAAMTTVSQTMLSVTVSPTSVTLAPNATQAFGATARDQFGTALTAQPAFTWNTTGGGTITILGLFTAGNAAGGPFQITATNGTLSASAAVTVTASVPITMGASSVLPIDDSNNGGWLIAQQATLTQAATIQTLNFYAATPSGNLRLGVYDATGVGGGPGTKLAESAEISVTTTGWSSATVVTPIRLAAGTYWLTYLSSDNALHSRRTAAGGGTCWFYQTSYGQLPSVFANGLAESDTVQWSFYATLVP